MVQKRAQLIFLFLFLNLFLAAQPESEKKKEAVIRSFIISFNNQDYKALKKDFFFLGKVLLTKNKMREGFSDTYSMLGKIELKKINFQPNGRVDAEIECERNKVENEVLSFTFNNKTKITSVWLKNPDFYYPFSDQDKNIVLNADQKKNKIDSMLQLRYHADNFNGSVLVIDNGDILYKKSFGFANYQTKELLNDSTSYCLASLSKGFTAIAVMMLQEQGKLNLSDNINKFLPDLPKQYQKITIENLLTHTSGLSDYMNLFNEHWDKSKVAGTSDVIKMFATYQPKVYFSPGERFSYSNTGYVFLAAIIEKVSGTSYKNYLENNIFKPLKMNNSFIGGSPVKGTEQNYAYGYEYSERQKRYIPNDSLRGNNFLFYLNNIDGDGSVNSSITDLAKWDKALRSNILIGDKSLAKMMSSFVLNNGKKTGYGYGFFLVGGPKADRIAYHTGGWPGYHNIILHFLDKDKTVIVLSNNEYLSFNRLADDITKLIK